jgi:hypothetical protein
LPASATKQMTHDPDEPSDIARVVADVIAADRARQLAIWQLLEAVDRSVAANFCCVRGHSVEEAKALIPLFPTDAETPAWARTVSCLVAN